jgi:hypothetical protein
VLDTINLNRLIPIYRRDADDVTGAVRMSSVEMVSMEQMPGGRFQVTVRTSSGAQLFITSVFHVLDDARDAMENFRAELGGEVPMFPRI